MALSPDFYLPQTPREVDDLVANRDNIDLWYRVQDRLTRLQSQWTANAPERDNVSDNVDFREGDQAVWVNANPAENASHFARKLKVTVDLVNHVLNSVATTYVSPARRFVVFEQEETDDLDETVVETVDRVEEANEWYQEKIWDFGLHALDEVFLDADRDVLFTGTIAIEPRYVLDFEGTEVDGVEAIYYRRHEFEVLPSIDDPRKAEAVVFPVRTDTFLDENGATVNVDIRHYWDGEVFARLYGWTVDEEPEDLLGLETDTLGQMHRGLYQHGIGYLPIVFVKRLRTQREFYATGVDVNLTRQCKNVNKLITEFAHTVKLQHGYPWHKGPLKNANIAQDGAIEVDLAGSFAIATPGANVAGMDAGIQKITDNIAVMLGMAPGGLSLSPNSTQSGIAIIAQQGEQERVREERLPTWVRAERRYHRAAVGIYKSFSGKTDVPEGEVKVIHQRPKTQISLTEKERHLEWQRKHKLISRMEMLKRIDPDMSEESITKQLADADADSGSTKPQNGNGIIGALQQARRFPSAQSQPIQGKEAE